MQNISSMRSKAYLLGASFGASALIVQTELLRAVMEAAAGGTLAVNAALGAWLFWIALGASAGGLLAGRVKQPDKTAFYCSLLSLPLGLVLIFLAGAPRSWLEVGPGQLIPFETLFAWSAAACAPFALLVGISFPILARMAVGECLFERESTPGAVGGLWAAEAAGALVSGLLFTLVLAGRTTPVLNICLFASLPPLVGASSGVFSSRPGRIFSALVIPVVLLVIISTPRLENHFFTLRREGLGSLGKVEARRWTLYRHLLVSSLEGQTTVYDNGLPSLSFPDPYSDAAFLSILLSQAPSPERILVVGPSAYGLAQAWISAGAEKVVSVHPDQELERLLINHLPEDMRNRLHAGGYSYVKNDGRVFLARQAGWDLVVLNLEGPARINSARYYTPEFFRRVRRAFGPTGGVLALRLPVGANVPYPAQLDQAASIWASLKTCFDHLSLAVTQTHCHIFAADRQGLLSDNLDTLMARIAPFEDRVPGLTRYLLPMFYDSTRTLPMRQTLDSRSIELASHTDTAPVAWLHHLRLWVRLARQGTPQIKTGPGPVEALFVSAAALRGRGFIVLPALVVSVFLAFSWLLAHRRGESAQAISLAVVLSVGVAGCTAMGTTVLLIYLCQLVFGALFHQVALITAVFMAALALGSYQSAGRASPDAVDGRVVGTLAFALSLAAILPAGGIYFLEFLQEMQVAGTALSLAVFYLMVAAAGYCCGAIFPWAAALHAAASPSPRAARTASALDFADHFGACLGAVAFGVIAVPALGIAAAAASLALAMACPALFWFAVAAAQEGTHHRKR